MKFFIDSAIIDEIKDAASLGVISGVTTNPSLIAKSGRSFADVVSEIYKVVDGPISAEVKPTTTEATEMISEGREIAKIHKNMVVKIPMTKEGLKACYVLESEGVKCNVTLVFTSAQAMLAANAGASFVSPFVGRLDDISTSGIQLIEDISAIFRLNDIKTKIISASIRHPVHVIESALSGADIATIPYKVIMQMINHPLTDAGVEKFKQDYLKTIG